jgi:hypothetical protein
MIKALRIFFITVLLLSVSVLFAQSVESKNTNAQDQEQIKVNTNQVQKVRDIRHVVITGNSYKGKNLIDKKVIKYDEKGGIIVPDASKGAAQKQLTQRQKVKISQLENAKIRQKAGAVKVQSVSAPEKEMLNASRQDVQKASDKSKQ